MTGKDLAKLGGALLLGMAVAFPAGMLFADRSDDTRPQGRAGSAPRREVYSPKVLTDPYFLDQQRRNVEALERRCREVGELCAEAEAARRWLSGQD